MANVGILLRRNTVLTLRKVRPLAILMTVAIALLLVADSVVAAGITKYSQSITSDSALNMVKVTYTSEASRPITKASLDEFMAIPNVSQVFGWVQVDLTIANAADWPTSENPGALWGTPYIPGVSPKAVEGDVPANGPGPNEIMLPKSSPRGDYSSLLGKTIPFAYTTMTSPGHGTAAIVDLRVIGLYNYTAPGEDGVQPSYISGDLLLTMAASRQLGKADMHNSQFLEFVAAYIKPDTPESMQKIQTAASSLGYGVSSIADRMSSLGGLFRLLSLFTWVIGIFLVLFCVGVGGSVGGSWVHQRVREVGILKAIGWSRFAISRAFFLELAVVGGVIGLSGAIVGIVVSLATTTIISGLGLELLPVAPWTFPNPLWIVLGIVVAPLFLCLGGLKSALRLAKMDADMALRDL